MIKSSTFCFPKAITSVMAFLFISILSLNSFAEQGKRKPAIKVYFALQDDHGFPKKEAQSNFSCDDKIYAVVELGRLKKEKYELSVTWIDPANVERERTQYPFHIRGTETRLWSWLSLSRATGAGMLQWINPAAGLEEFIGPWTVEIRINNKKVAEKSFEVTC